jgi:hypothetical protein
MSLLSTVDVSALAYQQMNNVASFASRQLDKVSNTCNNAYNDLTTRVSEFFTANKPKIIFVGALVALAYHAPITFVFTAFAFHNLNTHNEAVAQRSREVAQIALVSA